MLLWHLNAYGEHVLNTVHFHPGSPEGEQWTNAFMYQHCTKDHSHIEQKGRNAQKEARQDKTVFMLISLTVSDFPSSRTNHNPTSEPQKKMYLRAIHNKVMGITMYIWGRVRARDFTGQQPHGTRRRAYSMAWDLSFASLLRRAD